MSAYKDAGKKTWYVKFRYKDWKGDFKWITKRGFRTKGEAVRYEEEFKMTKAGNLEMSFADFVEVYTSELEPRIKESTMDTKENIIKTKLIPYFGERKVCEITSADVMKWQNEMLKLRDEKTGKPYSSSYLKTLHNQLSAIFNHAIRFYRLSENPAQRAGNMGNEKSIRLNFWTLEEYRRFAEVMMDYPVPYYCYEMLYWTGIREGELMALTMGDFDFDAGTVTISKTYHRKGGRDIVTSPKTPKSNRVIKLPDFLCQELREYCSMLYRPDKNERLFPIGKGALSRYLTEGAKKAGLKHIRVHDLRHSHVSLLINMGYDAISIADRLGHESVVVTYRYAHLFPNVQSDMADKLNGMREAANDV